jgi:hypothetical protein
VKTCESCGQPDTAENPTREYVNGGRYHDQCAEESGLPEEEIA